MNYSSYGNYKAFKFFRLLFIFTILIVSPLILHSESYKIEAEHTGYHRGLIRIKLMPFMEDYIEDKLLNAKENEYIITNYPELDKLNQRYGVSEYMPVLHGLYDISPRSLEFRDRHREWGFHLWFKLTIDKDADIPEAVRSFEALDCIDIAEPVYTKRIFEPVSNGIILTEEDFFHKTFPNDPLFSIQWHYHNTGQVIGGVAGTPGADINLLAAWEIEKGHPDVVVAVFDGGIDYNHLDLKENMWDGIGPDGTNVYIGNHGTHVGGTISAVTNNSTGVAGIAGGSGIGDGVRLMTVQISSGESAIVNIVRAADYGAAISQNSWGYMDGSGNPLPMPDAVRYGIDYFIEYGGGDVMDGGLVIAAAGNSGSISQYYPAYYGPVIAVAATNNNDHKAGFSTYGSWIEISAPGENVLSTIANNQYVTYSGTSMSAPHVSGIAALLISNSYRKGFILSNDEIRQILISSADPIDHLNPNYAGLIGSGRANAYAALLELESEMQGIANPGNFNAQATDIDRIELSWNKNFNNDNVMILWSYDNEFGIPQENVQYESGDSLPGGGTVLYSGTAEFFEHTGLMDNTRYFYRAFSHNNTYTYSSGRTISATTLLPPISDFPWFEDFTENSPYRDSWEQDTAPGVLMWGYCSGDGIVINSSFCGNLNARFPLSLLQSSSRVKLITPALDLSGHTDATLTFYYGQAFLWGNQNELKVFYRTSPGGKWILLDGAHFTSDVRNWTQVILDIPSDTYQIAFEGYNTGGAPVVLDCVEIAVEIDAEIAGVPVFRFFNHVSGGHLYTISEHERDTVMQLPNWTYEGPKFNVKQKEYADMAAVYRLFNTNTGIHLYTISEHERDTVMQLPEWDYEGVKFFVYEEQKEGSIPVYRFFNHVRGGHFYTVSEHERDTVMNLPDWTYEGISFYVLPLLDKIIY